MNPQGNLAVFFFHVALGSPKIAGKQLHMMQLDIIYAVYMYNIHIYV
jgi:hypothetical protein